MVWGDWIAEWGRRDEPEHLRRGRLGERAARRQLSKAGLKFLYANFSSENGEIDLVFREAKTLVFVEVKTRGSKKFGKPEGAIDKNKISLYKDAAEGYLEQYPSEAEIRFDVISIVIAKNGTQIEYFQDAF